MRHRAAQHGVSEHLPSRGRAATVGGMETAVALDQWRVWTGASASSGLLGDLCRGSLAHVGVLRGVEGGSCDEKEILKNAQRLWRSV